MNGRITRATTRRIDAVAIAAASGDQPEHSLYPPSPPATPASSRRKRKRGSDPSTPEASAQSCRGSGWMPSTPTSPITSIELPHGLGKVTTSGLTTQSFNLPQNRSPTKKVANQERGIRLQNLALSIGIPGHNKPRLAYLKYGHIPGETPFPKLAHPTPDECEEVYRRLSAVYGEARQSDLMPPPSLQRAGCGDVRSVLDALIRTYLSSNTSDSNSSLALMGMTKTFGLSATGAGQGSADYTAVREGSVLSLQNAIHSGGMAPKKSRSIKALLNMVFDENSAWRGQRACGESQKLQSATTEFGFEPSLEALMEHVQRDLLDDPLSLQYVNLLSTEDAIVHMVEYPGIGIKTAACVALYCLRRDCFPVDTHVLRICKGLGWTPMSATDNQTFSHCEHMIPGHLKYGLHHLFVRHGKNCSRCRAGAGPRSERWHEGCVLDDLLDRDAMMTHKGRGHSKRLDDEDNVAVISPRSKKDVSEDGYRIT